MRQVVKDRFHAFSTPFEGRRYHMYLDVKGLVTTGVGNLLASPQAASALDFKHGGAGGAIAGDGEVEAAWQDLKDHAPWGKPSSVSAKDVYGQRNDLRLDNADIDTLVDQMLAAFDNDLKMRFTTTPAQGKPASDANYADYCADAQLGLLSMQWPGSFHTFVTFQDAVRNSRWFEAARQCYFDVKDNPGIIPRNRANRWLFSVAGRMRRFQAADANELHYAPGDPHGVNKALLVKNGQAVRYDWDLDMVDSGPLGNFFKLPAPFDAGVDATFNGYGKEKVPDYFGYTYFTKGDQYVRYNWDLDAVDVGPLPLSTWGFKGAFAQKIDAAVNGQGKYEGKLYLFRGDKYVRYDWALGKVDQEPMSTVDGWDLPPEFQSGVDAVVNGEGKFLGKLYFIKGDKYVRFKWGPKYQQDGAVKTIAEGWDGTGAIGFAAGLDTVVNPPGRS